jgi:hypothetical protein
MKTVQQCGTAISMIWKCLRKNYFEKLLHLRILYLWAMNCNLGSGLSEHIPCISFYSLINTTYLKFFTFIMQPTCCSPLQDHVQATYVQFSNSSKLLSTEIFYTIY